MTDILNVFPRYCATRYSEFKNDLKKHLKKHGKSLDSVAFRLSTSRSILSTLKILTYRYLNIFVLLIHYKCIISNNINI